MTPPSLKTRLLGHPIVALPMIGLTLWSGYEAVQNSDVWPMAALAFVLTGIVMKANEQLAVYAAWKRAWDGMAPSGPLRPRHSKRGLALLLVAAVAGYLGLTIDQPSHMAALVWMATAAIGAAIVLATRAFRARRKRRPAAAHTVTVCIGKPLMPVPDLNAAYQALPAYCWQVLGGGA